MNKLQKFSWTNLLSQIKQSNVNNFMSKEVFHQQLIKTKHSRAQKCTLTLKGQIYCTLNQGSRIFQNVTKSTVFTTWKIGLPKKGH